MSLRVRPHRLPPEELAHLLFNRCLIKHGLCVLDERRRAVCVLGLFLLGGDRVQAIVLHEGLAFGHLREGVSCCHEALVGVYSQVLLQQEFEGGLELCTIVYSSIILLLGVNFINAAIKHEYILELLPNLVIEYQGIT